MVNTTETAWMINGESLQTYARNIRTWGGVKQAAPPLRGEDLLIPHRAGRRFVEKIPDSDTIDFDGWVIGALPDGTIGDRELFLRNWAALRRLFFSPRKQLEITKKWRNEQGDVESAVGLGQAIAGVVPESTSPTRATFVASVFMADPFFYGEPEVLPLVAGMNTVTVKGDWTSERLKVRTPSTGAGAVKVEILGAGDKPETSIGFTKTSNTVFEFINEDFMLLKGGVFDPAITHLSTNPWLSLPVGEVKIRVTGTVPVQLEYQPVWF